jgi:hypothetical protein
MTALRTEFATPATDAAASQRSIVFLTGCGRSGTTILGTVLGRRREVRYLNDQFRLWTESFAAADIWTDRREPARVALTEADATADGRARLMERLETARGAAPVVIEKLAINNFRLGFLRRVAPEARFINIRRHGVEVARSIARKIEAGEWYGHSDRKWRLLAQHAEGRGLGELAASCETPYERGLLEWRMSVEAAAPWVEKLAPESLIAVTYEELLADPAGVTRRIEGFLGLPPDPAAAAWAKANLARQHPAADQAPVPASTERIAGETLRRFGYTF